MIDQPTIDRILDAAQIMDVVSDFVTLRTYPPQRISVSVSLAEKVEPPFTSS